MISSFIHLREEVERHKELNNLPGFEGVKAENPRELGRATTLAVVVRAECAALIQLEQDRAKFIFWVKS